MYAGSKPFQNVTETGWAKISSPGFRCAHNILGDVVNADGEVVFGEDRRAVDTFVDGSLVTGRHPGVVAEFMERFLAELVRRRSPVG